MSSPSMPEPVATPSGVVVAPARAEDGSALEAILEDAVRWQRSRGIDQWRPGGFGDEVRLTIASGELFAAHRDGALVGCFMLALEDPPQLSGLDAAVGARPGAHLARLAVARVAAGRGLGRELIDAAAVIAARAGRTHLRLVCPADNERLQRYYREAGFVSLGEVATVGPAGERWVVVVFERRTAAA